MKICHALPDTVMGFICEKGITQWFLTWVRSNPRGSLSHSQGFGRGQDTHSIARFTLAMSGRFYRPSKNWLPTIWQHTIFLIYTYVLKKSYFIFPITKGSVNVLM